MTAGLVYLLAHACYKGALFLVAGAVDHETGTRNVAVLGGLRRAMPLTAIGAALAAGFDGGHAVVLGFVAKEQLYDSVILATLPGFGTAVLVSLAVAASMCLGAAGLIAGLAPFRGDAAPSTGRPRRAAGDVARAARPGRDGRGSRRAARAGSGPIALASEVVTGTRSAVQLALWHGFTPTLAAERVDPRWVGRPLRRACASVAAAVAGGAAGRALYSFTLAGLDGLSRRVAPAMQSGSLRSYVLIVIVTAIALVDARAGDRRAPCRCHAARRRFRSTKRRWPR